MHYIFITSKSQAVIRLCGFFVCMCEWLLFFLSSNSLIQYSLAACVSFVQISIFSLEAHQCCICFFCCSHFVFALKGWIALNKSMFFFFCFDFMPFAHSPFARAFIYINLFAVYLIFNEFQSARVHVHILFGATKKNTHTDTKQRRKKIEVIRLCSICYETDLWLFSILCL